MTEPSDQPQKPPAGDERPEIYSIQQDKDGSFHFSRRDFLFASAAMGGTLLVRGVCPRFASSPTVEPRQAEMSSLPRVCVHTEPSIASDIAETLQQDDVVRLVSDHPDLGWVQVATRGGRQGWVKRDSLDFSRATISQVTGSATPDSEPKSTPTPAPTDPQAPLQASVHLSDAADTPPEGPVSEQALPCTQVIYNGGFEFGGTYWVEQSTGTIVTNQWPSPYSGSWVAWFGGPNAHETLTQSFHVPASVADDPTLVFYITVTSYDSASTVYDTFCVRFLNSAGAPVSSDILIANNTTRVGWTRVDVSIWGMHAFSNQNLKLQFACNTDSSGDTFFVVDSVSLTLCQAAYVYLPIIIRPIQPSPTATSCASDCGGYCGSHCSSDYCSSDYCSSDYCIYYCGSDGCYDWSWG